MPTTASAATWLARAMVEVGSPLQAGDVIMTGALGPMVEVTAGDVIDVRLAALGSVRRIGLRYSPENLPW
jgi:2-keto-4-pentenoate hydratase